MTVEPGTLCTFCSSHAPEKNHWGFIIIQRDPTEGERMVVYCTNPSCALKFKRAMEKKVNAGQLSWANVVDVFFEGTDPLDITFR